MSLTQPLLRGAFARIVTQPLSLQERGTLYAIRDFARFRRGFYVDIVAGNGFLGLLTQLQTIRNTESNLRSLRRNLEEYQELAAAGLISLLERDQVAQEYQSTQFNLVQAQASLQTSLDSYKIRLGFPPDLELSLDDSILNIFELNDPRLDALRTRNEALYLSLLQFDGPALGGVHGRGRPHAPGRARRAGADRGRGRRRAPEVAGGPRRGRRPDSRRDGVAGSLRYPRPAEDALEAAGHRPRRGSRALIAENIRDHRRLPRRAREGRSGGVVPGHPRPRRQAVPRAILRDLRLADADPRLPHRAGPRGRGPEGRHRHRPGEPAGFDERAGRVTDAWRDVEVAANGLRGFLNLRYEGNLATDPDRDGIFRFDTSNSRHRVGVEFDAPLNRLAERNAYRAEQIVYQRARRQYMATHDRILREIRLDLRQLELSRRQFEIGREQLITASRQVEQAEYDLRTQHRGHPGDPQLAQALNGQLGAKNSLIGSWVEYETARMSLYRDFDIMDINAQGVWTNEHDGTPAPGGVPPVAGPVALPDGPRGPAATP